MGRRAHTPSQRNARQLTVRRADVFCDWLDACGWAQFGYYDYPEQPQYEFVQVVRRYATGNGVYRPQFEFKRRLEAGEYGDRYEVSRKQQEQQYGSSTSADPDVH